MFINYQDLDIKYVFDLMKFAEKLAIIPPFDRNKGEIRKFKYYSTIAIIVFIAGGALSLYGIIVYLFPQSRSTTTVLRVLCVIELSTMSIVTIVVATLNSEIWNKFLKLLMYLDEKLNQDTNVKNEGRNLLILEIFLYHVIIFTTFGYDAYVWCCNYSWTTFRFSLFRYINFYHCIITMLVVFHFASALAGRYKRINNRLVKSHDLHNIINNFIPRGSTQRISNLKSIKEVTDYYLLLSELVDMFNKLFGWQIFFATENIIVLLLDVSNSLMLFMDHSQKVSETNNNNNFKTIFCLISISTLLIISHSKVILHCEDVNKESRQTLTICYNLQQTVGPDSEERKELIILSEVVTLLKTRTTAAGFYYMDRGLLSRVFAYIFSYTIVLVQFNKQPVSTE